MNIGDIYQHQRSIYPGSIYPVQIIKITDEFIEYNILGCIYIDGKSFRPIKEFSEQFCFDEKLTNEHIIKDIIE
jgi:hypothetical protein